MNWNSEKWQQKGENFTVEIKHWKSPGIDIDTHEKTIDDRWNVYAYIFPKHPIFDEIKNDDLFLQHEIEELFHWGLSYHKWNYDADGAVYSKTLGSDYQHLHDSYEKTSDIENTPTQFDANRLFEYLKSYKPVKQLEETG